MKRDLYEELLRHLSLPFNTQPYFEALERKFGVSRHTLGSIYSQEAQKRVIKRHHVLKQGIAHVCNRYQRGADIIDLSYEYDFPPCIMLRRLLEGMNLGILKQQITKLLRDPDLVLYILPNLPATPSTAHPSAESEHSSNAAQRTSGNSATTPQTTGSAPLCDKDAKPAAPASDESRQTTVDVGRLEGAEGAQDGPLEGAFESLTLESPDNSQRPPPETPEQRAKALPAMLPTLPPEQYEMVKLALRLRKDITRCVEADQMYAPAKDASRLEAGVTMEEQLYAQLQSLHIAFWTEDMLRAKGFFKTPDAKLQVPIAIEGRIVNWIDSKATSWRWRDASAILSGAVRKITSTATILENNTFQPCMQATFGDDVMHQQYYQEQYAKYINRYGPGAVIYWFDYLEDLPDQDGLLLLNKLPEASGIVTLPQLPAVLANVPAYLPSQQAAVA